MRKMAIFAASLGALCVMSTPASAATITYPNQASVTFSASSALPSYITNVHPLADFDNPAEPFATMNGAVATNNGAEVLSKSLDGVGAKPAGSDGNFLSVLGGASYTLSIVPAAVVSFIEGSIDPYNHLDIFFTNNDELSLTGSQLGSGDGRLTIDTGTGARLIDKLVFSSDSNSYEIDSIVSSAPEAATWMLMILGFGVAGASLRGRKKEHTTALA